MPQRPGASLHAAWPCAMDPAGSSLRETSRAYKQMIAPHVSSLFVS